MNKETPNFMRGLELEKQAIEAGNKALHAVLLLNGGACIAILGFLASNLTPKATSAAQDSIITGFLTSLVYFAFGAGCAVCASAAAYLTNLSYSQQLITGKTNRWWVGVAFNRLAILFCLASIGLFFFGVWTVKSTYKLNLTPYVTKYASLLTF